MRGGMTINVYGFILCVVSAYAGKTTHLSALAKDMTEYRSILNLPLQEARGLKVVDQSAC